MSWYETTCLGCILVPSTLFNQSPFILTRTVCLYASPVFNWFSLDSRPSLLAHRSAVSFIPGLLFDVMAPGISYISCTGYHSSILSNLSNTEPERNFLYMEPSLSLELPLTFTIVNCL